MNKSVLLFGGSSEERLVSVASAQNVANHFEFGEILFLDKKASLFRITKEQLLAHENAFTVELKLNAAPLASSWADAVPFLKGKTVFLSFHGTEGEDGKIQALFEKNKIAFTGSGAESSQNSFNKKLSKVIASTNRIKVTEEFTFTAVEAETRRSSIIDFFKHHEKIVLKPVANGSSIGLYIVDQQKALEEALVKINTANLGDYIAEKFIVGRELTVGVYHSAKGVIPLPPSEVIMNQGRSFDYEGKYLGHGTTEVTPAQLTQEETKKAQRLALDAHEALNCYGYSRTDLILTTEGPVYLETNTLPGLSKASFLPQQLKAADISFTDFVQRQLELAEKRVK
jgi:D-alanine-D-alanine ligase